MAILGFKENIWTALAIGIGFVLAPVVIPGVITTARPLAKTGMKYGLMVYERSREMLAEITEAVEDLAAEAKAEVQAELEATKTKVT